MLRVLLVLVSLSLLALPLPAGATAFLGVFDTAQTQNSPGSATLADLVSLQWFTPVDCFAIGWISGSTFAPPNVLSSFSDAGWSQHTGTPTYADASGNPATVTFDLAFTAPLAPGTEILAAGYLGGNVFTNVSGEYFGANGWLFQNLPEPEWDPKGEVPEPASLLLLGAGIAAAVVRRRSRRQ